ncbi:unannotated protein [freshwater metagenome]|uniref:Unannotated protein n=1 Tax=freshwater metagenome TaxID=449393 RepID=A0A6J6T834_9ZZZZ
MAGAHRRQASQSAVGLRRAARPAQRAPEPVERDRQRDSDHRCPLHACQGGRPVPLQRGVGRQDRRRSGADMARTGTRLHDARALRRGRRDHPLEWPDQCHRHDRRAGVGGRQLPRHQATGTRSLRCAGDGPTVPRCGVSARGRQRGPQWPGGWRGTVPPPRCRQDPLHRQRWHGPQGARLGARTPHARRSRTRWQVSEHHLRRCEPRRSAATHDRCGRQPQRTGMPAWHPCARAAVVLRRGGPARGCRRRRTRGRRPAHGRHPDGAGCQRRVMRSDHGNDPTCHHRRARATGCRRATPPR